MFALSGVLLILFAIFANIYSFQTDWEHKQFTEFKLVENFKYYESLEFNNTEDVIEDARHVIESWRAQTSVPGVVIGLSIKGKDIWTEGFGQIDIENDVKTDKDSVWRLASISKPLTAALVAKLIDSQVVDLDQSIYEYLPKDLFPEKTWNGIKVNITLREVLSHKAGFHLTKLPEDFEHIFEAQNVSQTLELLKNEKLLFNPGTEYSYSNYGYQVIGAIIESVLKNTYQNEMKKMFLELGMKTTFAEERETIIEHRPRYYASNSNGKTVNVDIIDDLFSYEGWWPSGGMVSTVSDLLRFGNAMLSAYNGHNESN
jgi:serine beta-lactamase-like protein LACTB